MSYLEPGRPGPAMLVFGTFVPAAAILIELATGLCADIFFNPLPSWGHVLIVAVVPAANYALWQAAQEELPARPPLILLAGAAMAIAGAYALIFVPIAPIAVIALIAVIGILPLAPLLAFIVTIRLTRLFVRQGGVTLRRLGAGLALGLCALVLLDLPAAATQLALRWSTGDEASVRRATALMRAAGDETMLLRLCHGSGGRHAGPFSLVVATLNDGLFSPGRVATPAAARELYFRATGRSYNAEARARAGLGDRDGLLFDIDEDRGGAAVGGRVRDLGLSGSRIDGSIAAGDNVAYLEWTASFDNRSPAVQEARLTLALPEGAVASRATLWVNGEPREASVGGRAETRAAYQAVVRQSRDPLLVTTDGSGRLLVQAFPVPAGGSLKLRIGITAPLDITADGRRSVALPAIVERNFELAPGLRHQLWVEADARIAASGQAGRRLRAALDDAELAARPRIAVERIQAPSARTAIVPAKEKARPLAVAQTIERAPAPRPSSLIVLLDGSASNAAAAAGLRKALDAVPAGLPVGIVAAGAETRLVAPAPWSETQRARLERAIGGLSFRGGEDNVGALAEAVKAADGASAALLWIHGPQPVEFERSRARLEQLLERSGSLPRLIRYQAEPGRAFGIAGSAWFESARDVVPGRDPAADLRSLFAELGGGERWRVRRAETPAAEGKAAASVHIARLWAAERLAGAGASKGKEREAAIALAHRLNIVTPVSGAVVLERDAEYEENGLPVPGADEVPTVPEPEVWALVALAALLLFWFHRRRRPAFA